MDVGAQGARRRPVRFPFGGAQRGEARLTGGDGAATRQKRVGRAPLAP